MGDRRKRKSLWDGDEESRHFPRTSEQSSWAGKEHHFNDDEGRYNEYSASRNYSISKPREQSGQPYWESIDEGSVAPIPDTFIRNRQNGPEGKDISGGSRYFHDMSPGFEGMERHKYDLSRETTESHYHRYPEEGRSRSRSRSRTRARSRSRSLTRGRARERALSRSRSRSRGDGGARGQMRSRSPIGDSRQSHVWSDRRSLPGKSSQICRDFAAGRCRNGSQCRFLHSNGISRGDGEHIGDETSGSWKSRVDNDHGSKHAYGKGPGSDLKDDISDSYRGAEEQFQSKSRRAIPCKDFPKGMCRWGDSCRFSHHLGSDGTFGRGPRYSSFDGDIERHSFREGIPFCKFFAVGKCVRENCRFSHEDPKIDRVDGRRGAAVDERKNVSRWSHSLENEDKGLGIPEWTDASINEKQLGQLGGTSSYGKAVGTFEPISEEHTANKGETPLLQKLQLQIQEGNTKGEMPEALQEQDISMKAWQQNKSPGSHFQLRDHGVPETSLASSYRPDIGDEVKNSRSSSHSMVFSGQNQSQDVGEVFLQNTSISNEPDRPQDIYLPKPSNGVGIDSNNPETHLVHSLNMLLQMQNNQKAVQMAEILATKVPHIFPNLLNSEHCTQLANAPIDSQGIAPLVTSAFPIQRVDNEQSGVNADPAVSSTSGITTSISNSNVVEANPARVSYDLKDPTDNRTGASENGDHVGQSNQMQQSRSSPLSIIGLETDIMSPKLKQEKEFGKSKASEVGRAAPEESKGGVENKALDEIGKSEEGLTNKDDKGTRLFKNSLVEVVKDILKPTWKEGRMSRDIHKTIVKKVVDKVTSTIQMDHIPKTQEKIDQYLSSSQPKIAKLVQAYVGRSLKKDS